MHFTYRGTAVAQWLRCCATNRKVAGSIPAGVSGIFIDIKSWSHYGTGVDSASNRNEYQEYFLGVKSGWCVRLTTLPPSCAVVMKSGNLNFLVPSGPLQACNGTDLPYFTYRTSRATCISTLSLSTLLVEHIINSLCINGMTTRSLWKFSVCTTTNDLTLHSFPHFIYICDLRMAHSGWNMSST